MNGSLSAHSSCGWTNNSLTTLIIVCVLKNPHLLTLEYLLGRSYKLVQSFKSHQHSFIDSYRDSQLSEIWIWRWIICMRIYNYKNIPQLFTSLRVSACSATWHHFMTPPHGCLLVHASSPHFFFFLSVHPLLPSPLFLSVIPAGPLSPGLEYPKRGLYSFNVILISLTARQDKESS